MKSVSKLVGNVGTPPRDTHLLSIAISLVLALLRGLGLLGVVRILHFNIGIWALALALGLAGSSLLSLLSGLLCSLLLGLGSCLCGLGGFFLLNFLLNGSLVVRQQLLEICEVVTLRSNLVGLNQPLGLVLLRDILALGGGDRGELGVGDPGAA
jgi:hypothetical protein